MKPPFKIVLSLRLITGQPTLISGISIIAFNYSNKHAIDFDKLTHNHDNCSSVLIFPPKHNKAYGAIPVMSYTHSLKEIITLM